MLYQYTYFNSVWTFIHISIIFTFGSLNIEIGILIKLHIYYFWNLQEKDLFGWVLNFVYRLFLKLSQSMMCILTLVTIYFH